MFRWALALIFASHSLFATPYPDPNAVPKDEFYEPEWAVADPIPDDTLRAEASDVMRVIVRWVATGDTFAFSQAVIESSGTESLKRRVLNRDPLGSYEGEILNGEGKRLAHAAMGTGQKFRHLSQAMTFRFPVPTEPVEFRMWAENPATGKHEIVVVQKIDPAKLARNQVSVKPEVRMLLRAENPKPIKMNIYAEGYQETRRPYFWRDAQRIVTTLKENQFPGLENIEIRGVFVASAMPLGRAALLGYPVPTQNTFLGLYFPYWGGFERWFNVVYPTQPEQYRDGVGAVPYDYPFVVVDNGAYWGVGNFNEITAIPSANQASPTCFFTSLGTSSA